ncbi:hypothetical protein JW968_02495 [Candidatus Woesearchaeota archaeon]|nr:hypothetical protein [Candidatus Woesearchaeota archaeon]
MDNEVSLENKIIISLKTATLPDMLTERQITKLMSAGDPTIEYQRSQFEEIRKASDAIMIITKIYGADSREADISLMHLRQIESMYHGWME